MMGQQITLDEYLASQPRFDGSDCSAEFDQERLTGQIRRVFEVMREGRFRTLSEIAAITGDPEASISAQLRNLKNDRFGGWDIEKRVRGGRSQGLWEYRLVTPR